VLRRQCRLCADRRIGFRTPSSNRKEPSPSRPRASPTVAYMRAVAFSLLMLGLLGGCGAERPAPPVREAASAATPVGPRARPPLAPPLRSRAPGSGSPAPPGRRPALRSSRAVSRFRGTSRSFPTAAPWPLSAPVACGCCRRRAGSSLGRRECRPGRAARVACSASRLIRSSLGPPLRLPLRDDRERRQVQRWRLDGRDRLRRDGVVCAGSARVRSMTPVACASVRTTVCTSPRGFRRAWPGPAARLAQRQDPAPQ
jgi:hypothetical protein